MEDRDLHRSWGLEFIIGLESEKFHYIGNSFLFIGKKLFATL